jgi:RNase P subunit RPR2
MPINLNDLTTMPYISQERNRLHTPMSDLIRDEEFRRSSSAYSNYSIRYEDSNMYRIVRALEIHMNDCTFCNGFIICKRDARVAINREDPIIVRCSCGAQWTINYEDFRSRNYGKDMEDYIEEMNCNITKPIDVRESVKNAIKSEMLTKAELDYAKYTKAVEENKKTRVNSILNLEI